MTGLRLHSLERCARMSCRCEDDCVVPDGGLTAATLHAIHESWHSEIDEYLAEVGGPYK